MVDSRTEPLDSERGCGIGSEVHEGWRQTARREELVVDGQAPPDRPAFQPYWGKPAVRNDRGDDGDVGIIRSPVRAIVLPDSSEQELGAA